MHCQRSPQAQAQNLWESKAGQAPPEARVTAYLRKEFDSKYPGDLGPLCKDTATGPGTHVLEACTHRLAEGLYIERNIKAVAAIREDARGLSNTAADAAWHGKFAGYSGLVLSHGSPDVACCSRRWAVRHRLLLLELGSNDSLPYLPLTFNMFAVPSA